ncbi:MAG TPA: hypothetical protein PK349_08875 [Candidatus Hydrogenedentes bacterium]|nr:hypothetical protein [Candidatus Hydrogenedentota bacterium]
MPVYEQTYRSFEGGPALRWRWRFVAAQELRVLAVSRVFKFLVFLGGLHYLFRVMQIVAFDIVAQDPNNPLAPLLQRADIFYISGQTFYDFISYQLTLMFVTLLYAGSGMICNDVRNNLPEVYFSKPLRWYDYLTGKLLALFVVGFFLTAGMALLLLLQHALMSPSWEVAIDCLRWSIGALGYSAAAVLPSALFILLCSCLVNGQNYAAITVIMTIIANTALAAMFAETLRYQNWYVFSVPVAVGHVGEKLFQLARPQIALTIPWTYSLLYVAGFSLVCLVFLVIRVRKMEVAS